MDLLWFFRRSTEKQIQRLRKKVKEPHGDAAVRINAARRLQEMGGREALLALLDRFTIYVSPSRQDEEEKEEVLGWIVDFGEKAVPALLQFLRNNREVYWPVKALRAIVSREEFGRRMNELLQYHWENPPAVADPKAQLIRSLQGVHSLELEQTIRRYLEDEDDDVLLAALDYLFERLEEEAREPILSCYLESGDRPRIRSHILECFVEKQWSVRGFRPRVEETLPEGYILTRESTIKAVGRLS